MSEEIKYFIVKKKALPDVLLKVVEAKRRLDKDKKLTVQEVTDEIGLSRSSFYKYKDDILPFQEDSKGRTITFVVELEDEPGLCSAVLNLIATYKANILTIHQSIPVNSIALLTLSIDILPETGDVTKMIDDIESLKGIHYLKILARESKQEND